MLVRRAFKYRLMPTPTQVARLGLWEGAARFLWNAAHAQRMHAYGRCKADRKYLTAFDQMAELPALRAEFPWVEDLPYNVAQRVLTELDLAWQRWAKGLSGPARFKRKGRSRGSLVEKHPRLFRVEGTGREGVLVFPKLGAIPAVLHRPLEGVAKTCALVCECGQWFASLACEVELPDPLPSTKPPVGIDRGVVNLIADSDGRMVKHPRPLEAAQKRLKRAQQKVSRRRKGSKNQQHARRRVAIIHRKVRRQRDHALHVESGRYAKNHGAVIVEALNVRGMTASAKGTPEAHGVNVSQKAGLNRAILDGGWSRFVGMLRYKVVPEGGRVVDVPAAYSSQTCAECGVIDPANRRSQSEFQCVACGHTAHADVNAARVLLARGKTVLAVEATATSCGGLATGRPKKQQLRVARRGTRLPKVEAIGATPKTQASKPG